MNYKLKTLAAGILLAGAMGVSNQALALNIDNFDSTPQFFSVAVPTAGSQVATAPGESIGGYRKLDVIDTTGGVTMGVDQPPAATLNALSISNNSGVESQTSVTWNNNGLGLTDGTEGIDLTDGGLSTSLLLSLTSIDQGNVDLTFEVTDFGGDTASLLLSGLNIGLQSFFFNTFDNFALTDFTNVKEVKLIVDAGVAADLTLDLVETNVAVPEPAGIALLGLGLAGFSAFRKKKSA